LKLLLVNCCSILNNLIKFWNLVEVVNPDVIIGTELWLKEEINDTEIFEPQRDRDSSTRGGGIFVCVKTSVNSMG
ncbi:hypothetical protein C0J52_09920, partial [Blattella germanica]